MEEGLSGQGAFVAGSLLSNSNTGGSTSFWRRCRGLHLILFLLFGLIFSCFYFVFH